MDSSLSILFSVALAIRATQLTRGPMSLKEAGIWITIALFLGGLFAHWDHKDAEQMTHTENALRELAQKSDLSPNTKVELIANAAAAKIDRLNARIASLSRGHWEGLSLEQQNELADLLHNNPPTQAWVAYT